MKKIFLLIALCTSSCWATFNGYTYRREFTISASSVSSGQASYVNFPILVSQNDVTLSTSASGGHLSTGFDMVFSTAPDCSFLLNWDTETVMNVGVSTLNVWVEIPTISSMTDTPFFMCYGNAAITTYQGIAPSAWDVNYVLVSHLPDGVTLTANDSTSNANNGSLSSTPPTATSGKIGGGAAWGGAVSQYINYGTGSSITNLVNITLESWTNETAAVTARDQILLQKGAQSARGYNVRIRRNSDATDPDRPELDIVFSVTNASWYCPVLTHGTYTQIAMSYNNSSSANVPLCYINGVKTTATQKVAPVGSATVDTSADSLVEGDFTAGLNFLGGSMDEVRVSNIIRTPDWIKTEYNNISFPTTFSSMGQETQSPGQSGTALLQIQGGRLLIQGGKVLVQ